MDTNGKPKFEGKAVRLGGIEYVVPSLSAKQARKLWPLILEINAGVTMESIPEKYGKILEIIHAALSRNYPDITMEALEDLVDMGNIRDLQLIVIGQSGLASPGIQPVAEKQVSIQ